MANVCALWDNAENVVVIIDKQEQGHNGWQDTLTLNAPQEYTTGKQNAQTTIFFKPSYKKNYKKLKQKKLYGGMGL